VQKVCNDLQGSAQKGIADSYLHIDPVGTSSVCFKVFDRFITSKSKESIENLCESSKKIFKYYFGGEGAGDNVIQNNKLMSLTQKTSGQLCGQSTRSRSDDKMMLLC
jgi:predicted RNA-binding protein